MVVVGEGDNAHHYRQPGQVGSKEASSSSTSTSTSTCWASLANQQKQQQPPSSVICMVCSGSHLQQ